MIVLKSHGAGTSCNGNDYHHDIVHAVDDSRGEYGVTLCGIVVTMRNWFSAEGNRLEVYDYEVKPKRFGIYDCQKCAKILKR